MPAPASSTTVGADSRSPRSAPRAGSSGTSIKQRKVGGSSGYSGAGRRVGGGATSGGMWRFYTDDSPGIKVGPVPVLVMSLVFIASVFMLHIWGKYTRA